MHLNLRNSKYLRNLNWFSERKPILDCVNTARRDMVTRKPICSRYILAVSLFISLWGCSTNEKKDYVAKVDDSFLTESMIDSALSNEDNHLFREEFIRKWIEKQLLYLAAVDNGIVESPRFKKITEKSNRDIAAALFLENLMNEASKKIDEKDLENYFVENVSEFKLKNDKFLYSQVIFNNKYQAKKFRRSLIHLGWKKTLEKFLRNKSLVQAKEDILADDFNILPLMLKYELNTLKENSFSRVLQFGNEIYSVVWLKDKLIKGDIPEFYEIKDEVEQKYISYKRDVEYKNLVKNLYQNYKIEIKK